MELDLSLYLCHIADWGDRRKDFDLGVLLINGIYCTTFENFFPQVC